MTKHNGNIRATNRIQHFPETRALFFADGTQEVILQHKYTQMGASLCLKCTDGTQKKKIQTNQSEVVVNGEPNTRGWFTVARLKMVTW